jgi:cellulose synthase/poly-beta-1,6-N-acetylglucosamine synthase-like glycosyltransferase
MASAALALEVLRSHWQLGRNLDPSVRARAPARYPSLTVVRPIRGLDTEAIENLRAALDTGYPGECETLFVLDDEREPALALIHQAMREARAAGRAVDARVLFAGRPPAGRTGKLNAMIVGLHAARGELVAFADSDIRPDREALRALVRTLLDPWWWRRRPGPWETRATPCCSTACTAPPSSTWPTTTTARCRSSWAS